MTAIRYWFLGFRAGWHDRQSLPIAAAWTTDPRNRAYYDGYAFGAHVAQKLAR